VRNVFFKERERPDKKCGGGRGGEDISYLTEHQNFWEIREGCKGTRTVQADTDSESQRQSAQWNVLCLRVQVRTLVARKMDQQSILDFTLSNESWSNIFITDDVNLMFNSFLNTYL